MDQRSETWRRSAGDPLHGRRAQARNLSARLRQDSSPGVSHATAQDSHVRAQCSQRSPRSVASRAMSDVHKVHVLMQSRQAGIQSARLQPPQAAAPSTHSRSKAMQDWMHSDVAYLAMADALIVSAQTKLAGPVFESLLGTRAGSGYRVSSDARHGTWLLGLAGDSGVNGGGPAAATA